MKLTGAEAPEMSYNHTNYGLKGTATFASNPCGRLLCILQETENCNDHIKQVAQ